VKHCIQHVYIQQTAVIVQYISNCVSGRTSLCISIHGTLNHICLFTLSTSSSANTHHNRFTAFFRDHPGEPVPEENFWTLWCKGRLTETETLTIQLGATPSRLTSAHLHHPTIFFTGQMPSCHPTNNVKALKATLLLSSANTDRNK